jgi:hypothetical protein
MALLTLILAALSCSDNKNGTAVIEGRFSGGPGIRLFLEELDPMGTLPVDSATTSSDGSFLFTISPTEEGFYILKTADGRMTVITAGPGDTLELACEAACFPENVVITGPDDARLLGEFYSFSYRQKARSDSLQKVLESHRSDSLFVPLTLKFDTLFRQIWEEQRAFEITFLEQHLSSLTGLIVVNYSFGVRPVLSMEEDMAWYKRTDSALTARYPGNRHVQYNNKRITDFERQQQLNTGTKP